MHFIKLQNPLIKELYKHRHYSMGGNPFQQKNNAPTKKTTKFDNNENVLFVNERSHLFRKQHILS